MRLCFIYFLVLFIFEYGNGVIAPSTNSKNGEKDKSGIVHVTSGPIHALPNQQFGKRNKHKIVAEVMPFVSVPLLSISKKKVDKSVESSAVESDESLDSVEESEVSQNLYFFKLCFNFFKLNLEYLRIQRVSSWDYYYWSLYHSICFQAHV